MHDHPPLSMHKALITGLSEVTRTRTLELFEAFVTTGGDRSLNFRGDVAEQYGYDKIKPTTQAAQAHGNVVVIEAVSQKKGDTAHYQILANQWKLLEVLARLD